MNKDLNDLIPEVNKNPEDYEASFNVWKDHKVVLDKLKEHHVISEYLYNSMSGYLRKKLGLLCLK